MRNHTPGPWRVKKDNQRIGVLDCEVGNWITEVFWDSDGDGTGDANAALIAAAPSLFEACVTALGWIARNTPLVDSSDPVLGPVADEADRVRAQLRAAIAEAEGGDT